MIIFLPPLKGYSADPHGFSLADNIAKERIELFYNNSRSHRMCFDSSNWPNASGSIALTNITVSLLVDERRYEMSMDEEYCPGCEIKIPAHSKISAFISYSKFSFPKQAYGKKKHLEFVPVAHKC